MSRGFARVAMGVLDALLLPLGERQRAKTLGRVHAEIGRRGAVDLPGTDGGVRVASLRGPHMASSVVNFLDDEPETLRWIDGSMGPGDVLWDVGAATGLYALYAARRTGARVYAFEPMAPNFAALAEHVAWNGLGGLVVPLCLALSDETGMTALQLATADAGGAGNAIAGATDQFGRAGAAAVQGVPAMRGDDAAAVLSVPAPTHVKLDVDGIEPRILAGMPRMLAGARSVLVEVEGLNARSPEAIEAPLAAAGLVEDAAFREGGSGRNRLYVRPS